MPNPPIVTRFAPSPTGFLHIGGARTALFNWAFARHHGGKFLLRVEDTDRARSTDAAIEAILDGMGWLGLESDAAPVFQHQNAARHVAIAHELLEKGAAYICISTPEEVEAMREKARAEGRPPRYDGTYRERGLTPDTSNAPYVIRFKAPQSGQTVIDDLVQGQVVTDNEQFDDLVLLRADGSPTYMLSVVVDDYDMGVTHIIRGDDHLTNAARQSQIYQALGWPIPQFAHIPLIHGADGAKLSKRHGALGVDAYRDMGLLPAALRNYLARLGWSHGDDEVFTIEQFIDWFNLDAIGRSPARFDMGKLTHINAQHMRMTEPQELTTQLLAHAPELAANGDFINRAMPVLVDRAKTLLELRDAAAILLAPRPLTIDDKAAKALKPEALAHIAALRPQLAALDDWSAQSVEACITFYLEAKELKLGAVGPALRAAMSGGRAGGGIFALIALFDKDEALARLDDQLTHLPPSIHEKG
jgi:glutamyl-tRNA synthetase